MPRVFRETLVSARDLLATAGPFLLLALVLLVTAYFLLDPTPPKRVVLAIGPEDGAYAEFGKRYAAELKRYGIDVHLKTTQGAAQNLRLLRTPKEDVDLAFVQGGSSESARAVEEEQAGAPLVSLGSLFYEPVWLFYREQALQEAAKRAKLKDTELAHLNQLRGWRVNVGARGSGGPGLTAKLLHANNIDPDGLQRSRLEQTPAVVALLDGQLDALVLVSAPESPMVQMLLQTPGVRLFEFGQADAYARRFNFLSKVVLPRGVVDLATDLPSHDAPLIATTTSLIAREDTHPAVIQLFVQAANKIHARPGWFARAGQFPSPENSEFPLAKEAERYFKSGAPLLQRYLPFWLANLIDRMWVALISIIAVLIPLSRIIPPIYEFRVRSRVFRWYGQLRRIEEALAEKSEPPGELAKRLDQLDQHAEHISVPLSYADELYALRSHIRLVRERLREA
jgi:TRAP-type uncharacterized transport system substrate-binding protein